MNMPRAFLTMLLLVLGAGASRADDIDIYTAQPVGSLASSTILVLDLNAVGICDNVITNPSSQQSCANLQTVTTLQTVLGDTSSTSVAPLPTTTICALYGALVAQGTISPVQILGVAVTTATCNLLGSLNPYYGTIVNSVGGIYNPLLTTTVSNLSSSIRTSLNNALPGAMLVLADANSLTNLATALTGLLLPLINSNVGVVVSHANRNSATNTPPTSTTAPTYSATAACLFNDMNTAASLGSTRRSATTNCSNGGYFALGFFNIGGNAVTATNKILQLLLGGSISSTGGTVSGGLLNLAGGAGSGGTVSQSGLSAALAGLVPVPYPLTPPFQEVENYDEIVHYLKDDVVYNGPLNAFDGPIFKPLGRDQTIETNPGTPASDSYTSGAATVSSCRVVNVINLQVTNDTNENDSDADVKATFPGLASGAVSLPSLVQTAASTGFVGKDGKQIYLNSMFIIQDNLLPNIAALQNVGVNTLGYSYALGLFGTGATIPLAPTLVTDAALATASNTSDRSSATGIDAPTFFPEFRPAAAHKPAWSGNVKRLDLSTDSNGNAIYVDANGASAIAGDGRIKTTALTIWTDPNLLGTGVSVDGRTTTLGGAGQHIPGYMVNGGGTPGIKNASGQRQLYYDSIPGSSAAPLLKALDADTSASTWAAERTELSPFLGNCASSSDATLCQELLLYARGYATGTSSAPASNLATVTGRPWLMGAVLHSKPVAINYGARSGFSAASPDVRVLFGSTDGFMRLVRNPVGNSVTATSGVESWAFMPRAAMADLTTLRDNNYVPVFPYGMDGAPAVLVIDQGSTAGSAADGKLDSTNPNDHVYAYFGQRRGGASYATGGGYYYALDITNPDAPSLMWRIGRDGVYSANASTPGLIAGTAGFFTELGQTFSTPAIGKMSFKNDAGTVVTRPVVIFGGGYNGGRTAAGALVGKDLNNTRNTVVTSQVGTDDSVGNAIFIVDAVTGDLIWKAKNAGTSVSAPASATTRPMVFGNPMFRDGIASDVTLLDTDGDGLTDRLYVGDTGGRIWRADFAGTDRSKWTAGPIATLGRGHATTDATAADDRRFFHAPDYVPLRNGATPYDVVLVGSGDREDPFNATTTNWLYALRDTATVSGKTLTATDNTGVISSETDARLITQAGTVSPTDLTTACAAATTGPCTAAGPLPNGWKLKLGGTGEKTTSAPVTFYNAVYLTTYVPVTTPSCAPAEGGSKLYGLSLADSRPYVQSTAGSGTLVRSRALNAPGIAGEVAPQTTAQLGVNADTVMVPAQGPSPIFWRENRGDDQYPGATR